MNGIIDKTLHTEKLTNYYHLTLDKNKDGVISWVDFEDAIEAMIPLKITSKNSRLKILRMRVEQHYKKYFDSLCEVGDENGDGIIDFNEWLNIMNVIIDYVRKNNSFPEWYEGLHKGLFRSNEFFDDRDIKKSEFVRMMLTWDVSENGAAKAFDFITENGTKKMDYSLFSELMKMFFTFSERNHPINMGLC